MEQETFEYDDGAVVEGWNDGFEPALGNQVQKMIRYPSRRKSQFIQVHDNVLSDELCDKIYNYAIAHSKPWGVYVSFDQVQEDRSKNADENIQEYFATEAVKALYLEKNAKLLSKETHGVAVWCLVSDVGAQVQYHLDYAELHRYETGEIVPPFYGGTLAVSPLYDMEKEAENSDEESRIIGGALCVNLQGLDHYRRCGYKERLGPALTISTNSTCDAKIDVKSNKEWTRIPYAKNRGIIFDGEFPHFVETTSYLPPNKKRVILGFNVFGKRVQAVNERAPEHSPQFNATVKLYQSMGRSCSKKQNQAKIEFAMLTKSENKPLARLLVGLARKHLDYCSTYDTEKCAYSFQPGDRVIARWRRGIRRWPATVAAILPNGSLDLHYDDGTRWPDAPPSIATRFPTESRDDRLISKTAENISP
mmetsp:Transcript_7070/g.10540  ORF Transcript_7070/g.10540 Transcript_7070/m.10540 type:complete len:420 (-) Transcript_7070:336-1595(-)